MDIPRLVDEFGKYYFQNRITHSSFHGVRGSFLLTSGKIENEIGWDSTCLTEDYDFAWKASGQLSLSMFLHLSHGTLIVKNIGLEEGFSLWLDTRYMPRAITDFSLRQSGAASTLVSWGLASRTYSPPPAIHPGIDVYFHTDSCGLVSGKFLPSQRHITMSHDVNPPAQIVWFPQSGYRSSKICVDRAWYGVVHGAIRKVPRLSPSSQRSTKIPAAFLG